MINFVTRFALSLALIVLVTSHTVVDDTAIKWSTKKLSWNDFQGQPPVDALGDAGTAIRITAEPSYKRRQIQYVIRALFIPEKSWYRDTTARLLDHEQLHFDLAELYARKVRKVVSELQESGENDIKTFNSAIQRVLNESNEEDLRYDVETLHGSLPLAQEKWKFQTELELALFDGFRRE